METPAERERRILELEASRAKRRAETGTVWPTPDDSGMGIVPVELAPGRGNLNYSSGFVPSFPTALSMIGPRTVSFARLFQSQPWVASAVMRMLSWAIRVPMRCYRHGDDPNDRIPVAADEHPLAAALSNPWNRGSQASLIMAMLGPMLVHGNSVIQILEGRAGKIEFAPHDWRFCMPIMPWRNSLEGFVFDTDNPEFRQEVSIDEILHTAWWSPTGPTVENIGTSPLQQLGVTLQIEDAAQRYQRGLFQNGARPPNALVMSEEFLSLDRTERLQIFNQMRLDIEAIYAGPENAGRPALLPPGLDWKGIEGGTAVEAALIDQRKITREEVAAVYLIPPPLLGILDKATYSNIQVQRDMTYTDCLGPPLVLMEQTMNAQVVRDLLRDDEVFVEFDFAAVLRGDRLQEIEQVRNAIQTALMSPNEGRSVLGFPKVQGEDAMDSFYLPTINTLQAITGEEAAEEETGSGEPTGRKPGQPAEPAPGDPQGDPPIDEPQPRGRHLHVRSHHGDYTKTVA